MIEMEELPSTRERPRELSREWSFLQEERLGGERLRKDVTDNSSPERGMVAAEEVRGERASLIGGSSLGYEKKKKQSPLKRAFSTIKVALRRKPVAG